MNFKDLTLNELNRILSGMGKKIYVAKNIYGWIYKKNISDFSLMSNVSKKLQEFFSKEYELSTLKILEIERSKDDCIKFLFELNDLNTIESVVIPHDGRITLCVSSQVGCKMGCLFCCTAKQGFERNLYAWEIVEQVLLCNNYLREKLNFKTDDSGIRCISNIVYMGMGEPLDNMENVLKSIDILSDDNGLGFGKRKITVSTCGLVPKMIEFKNTSAAKLALSLNAAGNDLRSSLMPVNNKYDLKELRKALQLIPMKKFEFVTIEYIMFHGLNDSLENATELVSFLKGLSVKVNLIPFNKHSDSRGLEPPTEKAMFEFYDYLVSNGIVCNVRQSRGADISAACGQLRSRNLQTKGAS